MADEDETSEHADGVHRLVDMVVEEVSLVDRAANQRRFLIVKRRQKMADEGAPVDDAPGKDNAAGGGAAGGTVTPEAMAAMTEALTALTELVTTGAAEKAFPPKKPKKDGDDEEDDEEKPDDEDDAAGEEQRRKAAESVTALLGQVKAALARLQTAVTTPAQKRAPAADPVLAKLEAIGASLGKIETQIKEQDGRLGKVEKNVGLPASRTPEGKGKGEGDDEIEVSWPMDLNAPMDRSSIDKSLSFHDPSDK